VNAQVGEAGAREPRRFTTTRWSLILSAAHLEGGEQKAREALNELCRTYWRPVFSFVCRHGYSMEDAQDLTQDFFVKILEPGWLRHGRSRSRTVPLTLAQITPEFSH
jgi:RNA polymerase sigma-70 factor (ECF subfamily)